MNNTQVIINAKVIDTKAYDQIKAMAQSPAFTGLISIMPDVHPGMGSVSGFTGKFNKCVIPNVVGVDIGCGVTSYPIGNVDIDFEALDAHIRKHIPIGFESHKGYTYLTKLRTGLALKVTQLCETVEEFYKTSYKKYTSPLSQIGTLGGGNHFIEIDSDGSGNKFITVHSGSRNFGLKVAKFFQNKAHEFHKNLPGNGVHKDLEYLPMEYGGKEYLKALYLAQEYAKLNREVMISNILMFFDKQLDNDLIIESVHNFIDPKDGIIRKGAISAHVDEQVIIPLNMRDGIVLGTGYGISKYNYSAPHGAGRLFGRVPDHTHDVEYSHGHLRGRNRSHEVGKAVRRYL